jgi:hypothetical protein
MAGLESLRHTLLPHEASEMAPRPKSSFDTHALHRNNSLLSPKYTPYNRLAQLWLDNSCRRKR